MSAESRWHIAGGRLYSLYTTCNFISVALIRGLGSGVARACVVRSHLGTQQALAWGPRRWARRTRHTTARGHVRSDLSTSS